MPRDINGSYSLPSGTLVSDGDTVQPSQHNPAMSDLGQSVGNSLSRDGYGGMRADLSMGGFKAVNMADGTAPTDGATVGQISNIGAPIGGVMDFAGATAPVNWQFCYGQAVSRTTFAALFAAIGTVWGAGDGSTTFNLPDFRGRTAAGKDDMGGSNANRLSAFSGTTLGAGVGAQNVVLTAVQMPTHNHPIIDPGHSHTYSQVLNAGDRALAGGGSIGNFQGDVATSSSATGVSVGPSGADQAHPNVQPTAIINKIIKVV